VILPSWALRCLPRRVRSTIFAREIGVAQLVCCGDVYVPDFCGRCAWVC
jgi:hypothetical protein